MRRFVPGVDSYLGAGAPASLMRFSDPEPPTALAPAPAPAPSEGVKTGQFSGFDSAALIMERPVTLIEKYRQLCYWRQVVNAENN